MKNEWVINKINLRHLTQRNSHKFMNVTVTWQNYWQMIVEGEHILLEGKKKIIEGGKGESCISGMSKAKWKLRKLSQNHTVKYLDEEAGKSNSQGTITVPSTDTSQPWHGGKVATTGV